MVIKPKMSILQVYWSKKISQYLTWDCNVRGFSGSMDVSIVIVRSHFDRQTLDE